MEDRQLADYQEQLAKEFEEKQRNNPNMILVSEKLAKLQDTIQQKIGESCGKLQAEYEKYGKADLAGTELKFTKYQGKEREFDAAWDSYVKCINPYMTFMFPLQTFLGSGADLMNRSYQFCVDNCATYSGNIDKSKACLKTCFDNNYANNARAFQASVADLVDLSVKEVQAYKNI